MNIMNRREFNKIYLRFLNKVYYNIKTLNIFLFKLYFYIRKMSIDLYKYQGLFYEVYRQNAYFEYICDIPSFEERSTVTAQYYLENSATLKVINTCLDKNKQPIQVFGYAQSDMNLGPTELALTLYVGNTEIKSRYIIFYTDYVNYSIVGDLKNNYLSFLSRTDRIDLATFNLLSTIATLNGFTVQK
jgi:lipocalin